MAVNPGALEQASFLHPRDPSITGWDQRLRFVAPVRKQLFNEILEEEEESVKPEKAGINTYLRLKPSPLANEQVRSDIIIIRTPTAYSCTWLRHFTTILDILVFRPPCPY